MAKLNFDGSLISVVLVLQDGSSTRFIESVAGSSAYNPLELVVVDNGMRRDAVPNLSAWSGAHQVIVNNNRIRLGPATNQAIRAAAGELVLLAHDDLEVVDPRWLDHLVARLAEDVVAVGPRCCATYFKPSFFGARGVAGTPEAPDVPALTGCLLARRSDLLSHPLGELAPVAAEWDLCLRLGNQGRIVVADAGLIEHHDDGFREIVPDGTGPAQRNIDIRSFNRHWGASVLRRLREEVSGHGDQFFRAPVEPVLKLVPGPTTIAERTVEVLTDEASTAGWDTTTGKPPACDLAVAVRPPKDVQWLAGQGLSVAAVSDNVGEWVHSGALDAAHVVLAADDVIAARLGVLWGTGNVSVEPRLRDPGPGLMRAVIEAARPTPGKMRIGVSTCAPDWPTARFWGDTHLARGLMRAFRRCGHEAVELTIDDWGRQGAAACDVVIHLRGLRRRPVAPGQWNVLWVISHPDRLEPGECDDFDLVASASRQHAEDLTRQLGREVHYLPQATDADTFRIGPKSAEYEGSVLYVGNARWPHRRAPRWLMRTGCDFDLFGKNWDDFSEAQYVRGEYIANRELPIAYRSAALVVADHHGSMRTNGFVANRIFDVLASGGLVLSDDVPGLPLLFGDVVPSYSGPDDLAAQVRGLVADPEQRRRLAKAGRDIVVARHTLDHRARRILELLDEL